MIKETKWVPLWKKIEVELDSASENLTGSKKSLIELPKEYMEKKDGFYSARVIQADPLAGCDAKSGIRYHTFKAGERILVNRMHIQRVFFAGKTHNYINDIFVIAYEDDGVRLEDKLVPEAEQYLSSELPSTICQLEDQELSSEDD